MLEYQPTNIQNHLFQPDFKYKHKNPYHDRLEAFQDFVMRDNEAETHQGLWKQNIFQNTNPVVVEIGSGYGEFMIEYSQKHPEHNFVGIDYRFKRSYGLAQKLSKIAVKNFRYLRAKGERLDFMFAENELDSIFYFFPDPWPKTRQHKKRLFQANFLNSCYRTLKSGGKIFMKTDHDGYFEWMCDVVEKEPRFKLTFLTTDLHAEFPNHFLARFVTTFEKIFLQKQTKIKAFILEVQK
ncbi:MAG: tRNA (guanosine(46)-N7)-methyltransferase TrmB [Bacteriovoracaceae bacterium]|nr:tRNA (guanosine(46)-N7)-methyltransferase TrmB [Bacteriovoracaceae bacterium]